MNSCPPSSRSAAIHPARAQDGPQARPALFDPCGRNGVQHVPEIRRSGGTARTRSSQTTPSKPLNIAQLQGPLWRDTPVLCVAARSHQLPREGCRGLAESPSPGSERGGRGLPASWRGVSGRACAALHRAARRASYRRSLRHGRGALMPPAAACRAPSGSERHRTRGTRADNTVSREPNERPPISRRPEDEGGHWVRAMNTGLAPARGGRPPSSPTSPSASERRQTTVRRLERATSSSAAAPRRRHHWRLSMSPLTHRR